MMNKCVEGVWKREAPAYLTVYLALCMTLILALCLALIEGARHNGGRLEAECVSEIALQSVLAEYHRELLEQYNIFAIDSSYGTEDCGIKNVEAHLQRYLRKNFCYDEVFLSGIFYKDFLGLDMETALLPGARFLTDYRGEVFRQCAVDAIKDDVGMGLFEELQGWMTTIEVNGLESDKWAQEKKMLDEEIASYNGTVIEMEDGSLEKADVFNPTDAIEERRRLGILRQVTDEESLSKRGFSASGLAGERMLEGNVNRGNMHRKETEGLETLVESFLFREYLLKYMGRYGAEQEEDVLKYQVEYLVVGAENDVDNLRAIANRLCIIREAANVMYLMGNEAKRAEIALVSEVVCSLIMLPELSPLMEAAILLGWAYAESVYDVKTLLDGGKVPLLKSDASWYYGLETALAGNFYGRGQATEGLGYGDYLRIFMMLTEEDLLTVRAMNMVEADIRNTPGNASFRLDACIVAVDAEIEIKSTYGYRYAVKLQKSYW